MFVSWLCWNVHRVTSRCTTCRKILISWRTLHPVPTRTYWWNSTNTWCSCLSAAVSRVVTSTVHIDTYHASSMKSFRTCCNLIARSFTVKCLRLVVGSDQPCWRVSLSTFRKLCTSEFKVKVHEGQVNLSGALRSCIGKLVDGASKTSGDNRIA